MSHVLTHFITLKNEGSKLSDDAQNVKNGWEACCVELFKISLCSNTPWYIFVKQQLSPCTPILFYFGKNRVISFLLSLGYFCTIHLEADRRTLFHQNPVMTCLENWFSHIFHQVDIVSAFFTHFCHFCALFLQQMAL